MIHDNGRPARPLGQVVDPNDLRMDDPAVLADLVAQFIEQIRVGQNLGRQKMQFDLDFEIQIQRKPNGSPASPVQDRFYPIAAQKEVGFGKNGSRRG